MRRRDTKFNYSNFECRKFFQALFIDNTPPLVYIYYSEHFFAAEFLLQPFLFRCFRIRIFVFFEFSLRRIRRFLTVAVTWPFEFFYIAVNIERLC